LTARQRIRKEYSEKNREAAGGDIAAGEEVVDEREREKILIERERESDGGEFRGKWRMRLYIKGFSKFHFHRQ